MVESQFHHGIRAGCPRVKPNGHTRSTSTSCCPRVGLKIRHVRGRVESCPTLVRDKRENIFYSATKNRLNSLQSNHRKIKFIDMTSLNFDDQDGILRTISDAPPTYYTVKIQSVSLLTEKSLEKYESGDFEARGYKWKLVFYPNGNKNRNVKEHISLYLVMLGSNAPQISSEVLFARSEQRQYPTLT
ncbi:hypothetical protein DVH24_041211 [Malus domestica]|uniref:MATH domain-containing protein n=1 Tax=Malus domestica TaxID=3750 RepID=A0A498ID94_MALDO|nr:hypothetical protein DVH24_041211 [Malus domestica]